jgi:hypothetical protein
MNARRSLGAQLDIFERLVERLHRGVPVPNAELAHSIEALREGAPPAENPDAYIPPMDPASGCLRDLYWALESLERGESGAPGHFVRNAREYLRLLREQSHDPS